MSFYSAVVLPDMHVPYEDKRAINAICRYMAKHRWDEVVHLGDFLDIDCISFHNKGKPALVEGKRLEDEYKAGEVRLDQLQEASQFRNGKAKFTLLEGNHEHRVNRYLEEQPQLKGLLEVPKGLNLKTRGIKWVPSFSQGKIHRIGKAHFVHGEYINDHHAKKMVTRYGVNIFYGHVHDVQTYSLVQKGKNQTLVGQSLGCLCSYTQSYMRDRPSNWQHAFGVFFFDKSGFFQYYVVRIFNGKFVGPDGELYEG